MKVHPQKSHYCQVNRQHTAGQQLTKRRKQLKALNPVFSDPGKKRFVVHTTVHYAQANFYNILISAVQMEDIENLIISQVPQRQA